MTLRLQCDVAGSQPVNHHRSNCVFITIATTLQLLVKSGGRHRVIETVLAGSVFLILTMAVRTSRSCGRSSSRRVAAMNDADAIPVPHGRPDIEWDEFVMA